MSTNPPLKFILQPSARKALEEMAAYHAVGSNEPSANEMARIICGQFALVPKDQTFLALAALRPFQTAAVQTKK